MRRQISILILLSLLTGCFGSKLTFDQNGGIEKLGIPVKIEYINHEQSSVTFVISDQKEIKDVMDEIKYADNPEPWKGAGWSRIKIYYADTILNINTNNVKIGTSSSGTFYDLGKKNFITKRMNKKWKETY